MIHYSLLAYVPMPPCRCAACLHVLLWCGLTGSTWTISRTTLTLARRFDVTDTFTHGAAVNVQDGVVEIGRSLSDNGARVCVRRAGHGKFDPYAGLFLL